MLGPILEAARCDSEVRQTIHSTEYGSEMAASAAQPSKFLGVAALAT